MTFNEAIQRRIWKIRLFYFRPTAYVDPRVTEHLAGYAWSPIIDPKNKLVDFGGKPYYHKALINPVLDCWEDAKPFLSLANDNKKGCR